MSKKLALSGLKALLKPLIKKAKAAKKKLVRKPKQTKRMVNNAGEMTRRVTKLSTAPASIGASTTTSRTKHTPFILSGRCIGPSVRTDAGAALVFFTEAGVASAINCFDVDPLATSTTSANFDGFPLVMYNVASVFTRYRFKKLRMDYIPIVSTGNAGNITFAANPESVGLNTLLSRAVVCQFQNNASTSVWLPIKDFDLMGGGGLRKEWLYCNISTAGQAAERQETPGLIATVGAGLAASTYYGDIYWDYEIEFDGIGIEVVLQSKPSSSNIEEKKEDSSSSNNSLFINPVDELRYPQALSGLVRQQTTQPPTPAGWTSVQPSR